VNEGGGQRVEKWERQWKLELIESFNPEWADLYDTPNA
jgi:predicted GIY-YIG superfamily endonuclease